MQFRTILVSSIIFFSAACIAYGYTVILKNGKQIEGSFVEEDDSKILIKDKDGIILTFRKSTLDLDAMEELNEASDEAPAATCDSGDCGTQTLKNEKEIRKPPKRIFTNEDLKDLPELSIAGSDTPVETTEPEEEPAYDASDDESIEAEAYWKEQTSKIAEQLNAAEDQYNSLKKNCEDARQELAFYVLNGYWGGNLAVAQDATYFCSQAEDAKTEWERWKGRLEDFQEQARREGALPGWVDPDRLNR
jgi:hypothetical protein